MYSIYNEKRNRLQALSLNIEYKDPSLHSVAFRHEPPLSENADMYAPVAIEYEEYKAPIVHIGNKEGRFRIAVDKPLQEVIDLYVELATREYSYKIDELKAKVFRLQREANMSWWDKVKRWWSNG